MSIAPPVSGAGLGVSPNPAPKPIYNQNALTTNLVQPMHPRSVPEIPAPWQVAPCLYFNCSPSAWWLPPAPSALASSSRMPSSLSASAQSGEPAAKGFNVSGRAVSSALSDHVLPQVPTNPFDAATTAALSPLSPSTALSQRHVAEQAKSFPLTSSPFANVPSNSSPASGQSNPNVNTFTQPGSSSLLTSSQFNPSETRPSYPSKLNQPQSNIQLNQPPQTLQNQNPASVLAPLVVSPQRIPGGINGGQIQQQPGLSQGSPQRAPSGFSQRMPNGQSKPQTLSNGQPFQNQQNALNGQPDQQGGTYGQTNQPMAQAGQQPFQNAVSQGYPGVTGVASSALTGTPSNVSGQAGQTVQGRLPLPSGRPASQFSPANQPFQPSANQPHNQTYTTPQGQPSQNWAAYPNASQSPYPQTGQLPNGQAIQPDSQNRQYSQQGHPNGQYAQLGLPGQASQNAKFPQYQQPYPGVNGGAGHNGQAAGMPNGNGQVGSPGQSGQPQNQAYYPGQGQMPQQSIPGQASQNRAFYPNSPQQPYPQQGALANAQMQQPAPPGAPPNGQSSQQPGVTQANPDGQGQHPAQPGQNPAPNPENPAANQQSQTKKIDGKDDSENKDDAKSDTEKKDSPKNDKTKGDKDDEKADDGKLKPSSFDNQTIIELNDKLNSNIVQTRREASVKAVNLIQSHPEWQDDPKTKERMDAFIAKIMKDPDMLVRTMAEMYLESGQEKHPSAEIMSAVRSVSHRPDDLTHEDTLAAGILQTLKKSDKNNGKHKNASFEAGRKPAKLSKEEKLDDSQEKSLKPIGGEPPQLPPVSLVSKPSDSLPAPADNDAEQNPPVPSSATISAPSSVEAMVDQLPAVQAEAPPLPSNQTMPNADKEAEKKAKEEKVAAEKVAADRLASHKAKEDKAAADKLALDKAKEDKAAADKAAAEEAAKKEAKA